MVRSAFSTGWSMMGAAGARGEDADRSGCQPEDAAWECFHRSIHESLDVWPQVLPMPEWEDPGDPTVRALQRARRYTWLHARHGLGWSMFEAIRISVRLAEAFTGWTRDGAPDMDALASRLEQTEQDARRPAPVRDELHFVDRLMEVATATDLRLADMELAMEAFRKAETQERARAVG